MQDTQRLLVAAEEAVLACALPQTRGVSCLRHHGPGSSGGGWRIILWLVVLLVAARVEPARAVEPWLATPAEPFQHAATGGQSDDRVSTRLHLVATAGPPFTRGGDHPGFLEVVAHEAFRRVGVQISISVLPDERALLNVNAGIDDGDLSRNPAVERDYPNLVRVPEPIWHPEYVAFTTQPAIQINGWQSLKPYVVGYVKGWKIFEQNVSEAREITTVRTATALFGLLQHNRAEVVLIERMAGLYKARALGLSVRVLEPPLAQPSAYTYLHARHAALAPRVARALQGMKADGSYQHFYDTILKPLALQP